jgi:hypothetical protein
MSTIDVDAALILCDVQHLCVASKILSCSHRHRALTRSLRQCKWESASGASDEAAAAKFFGMLLESAGCAIYDTTAASAMLIAAALCTASYAEATCTHTQIGVRCSFVRDA